VRGKEDSLGRTTITRATRFTLARAFLLPAARVSAAASGGQGRGFYTRGDWLGIGPGESLGRCDGSGKRFGAVGRVQRAACQRGEARRRRVNAAGGVRTRRPRVWPKRRLGSDGQRPGEVGGGPVIGGGASGRGSGGAWDHRRQDGGRRLSGISTSTWRAGPGRWGAGGGRR
jgi:hypothetical protein